LKWGLLFSKSIVQRTTTCNALQHPRVSDANLQLSGGGPRVHEWRPREGGRYKLKKGYYALSCRLSTYYLLHSYQGQAYSPNDSQLFETPSSNAFGTSNWRT
jgi:hypothetical protein